MALTCATRHVGLVWYKAQKRMAKVYGGRRVREEKYSMRLKYWRAGRVDLERLRVRCVPWA